MRCFSQTVIHNDQDDWLTKSDDPNTSIVSESSTWLLMWSTSSRPTLSPKNTTSGLRIPPHSRQDGTWRTQWTIADSIIAMNYENALSIVYFCIHFKLKFVTLKALEDSSTFVNHILVLCGGIENG